MKRPTALAAALALAVVISATPAGAGTADGDRTLQAKPPASTAADVAPVLELYAPVHDIDPQTFGIIKRSADLAGETRHDASEKGERFTLKGDVFFDIDKATLTATAKDRLTDIVDELTGVDIAEIVVGGHTDTVGTDAHNAGLSQDRADTVADFLREGLDDVDITAEGFGPHHLLVPEEGSEEEILDARSRNRRVEITVTYLDAAQ